ncbi:HNH endonuclease [Hyphomonas sp.]|uniref:HNH endonuclease n=1 Tax=Hyphomonas sp. TaxID=87 RepID=UPI0030FA392B
MKIKDLPAPITAAKADWLPGTTWVGFTPTGTGPDAREKCQTTINRQVDGGYVIERITDKFGDPNPDFVDSERVKRERDEHAKFADSLVSIHRLRHSSRPLVEIIGPEEFDALQNVWSANGDRNRWSVAFPIVETFEIVGAPKARDVFSKDVFARHFARSTATLRSLDDAARDQLAELEIVSRPAPNLWVLLEDEAAMAELSDSDPGIDRMIADDLLIALEGETEERRGQARKRASWIANRFILERRRLSQMRCDDCSFDPSLLPSIPANRVRSCFDVHHKDPLAEGVRLTTTADFALLCPTCHRLEHIRLDVDRA